MAAQLTFFSYLQNWDGNTLTLNALVVPRDSPLDPMAASDPSFASAAFTFEVRLIQGLAAMPTLSTAFQAVAVPTPAPPHAADILTTLQTVLVDPSVTPTDPRQAGRQLLKYAPPGYRDATGYTQGANPYVRTDDTYHCALKSGGIPQGTQLTSDPPKLGWGKVLAAALRQPLLARAVGLVRPLAIKPPRGYFHDGGWVYVSLSPAGDCGSLLGIPGALKSYAARVPPLATARTLFTSVLFPVASAVPTASYDALFREVVDYDDGFAKAVYARQPIVLDPLGEQDDGSRPGNDHGIQLGWDDEQVATWLNRQIDPGAAVQDAPMAVLGYRVDARRAGTGGWKSLVMGKTELTVGSIDLGSHTGEFRVEIAPNKLMADSTDTFWLPSYYTAWTGPSLAGPDHDAMTLKGIDGPAIVEGIAPGLALRYGHHYEFRVRLADHTGGGPGPAGHPVNPAPQPLAPLHFLRWVQPAAVRVGTTLPVVPDPTAAPSSVLLRRPLLAYPAYVYAGGSAADLVADLGPATADGRAVGLADPDVSAAEVTVQVEFPGAADGFRTLYQTTRPFPAGPNDPLHLDFLWQDVKDARTLTAPAKGAIPLPTARLVRLRVSALAAAKTDYYGAEDVRRGPVTELALRSDSSDERALLRVTSAEAIEGIFLQPDTLVDSAVTLAQQAAGLALAAPDNPLGRLAAALDLAAATTGLRAQPGHRILFGVAPALRHLLGPDGGSVAFGSLGDLTRLWLIPIRLELDRDWSWDALDHISIERGGSEVGQIAPSRTVAAEALAGAPADHSELVFIDGFDPKPAAGQFPTQPQLHYTVHPVFRSPPGQSGPDRQLDLHLPITTPPAQVPKLVSAGLALSPYQRDVGYTQTQIRRKMVWLEFDVPPTNPADTYYARVLAEAADPVLTRLTHDLPESAEPPLPVDAEPIRIIVPGQSDDQAGASAMQLLQPTQSPRHFLLPLPPGFTADSPDLFGLFTYELRVGHHDGWTTAQGRFGRPLRVTGVQHPAPALQCAVGRDTRGIEVSAPFANPVRGGQSLRPFPPATQLWVLLYAQVHQADGTDMRNLLLGNRRAFPHQDRWVSRFEAARAGTGTATWSNDEVALLLELLGLDPDTPLSCLAVETLPGDQPIPEPVSTGLGYERFLRTSPLTPIARLC